MTREAHLPPLSITATRLSETSLNLKFDRPLRDSDHASVFGVSSFDPEHTGWKANLASINPGEQFTAFVHQVSHIEGARKLTSRRDDVTVFFGSDLGPNVLCTPLVRLRVVLLEVYGEHEFQLNS